MKTVIQRVSRASVSIAGQVHSSIGSGMLILLCVEPDDEAADMEALVRKISRLRIFDDAQGVMNLDITQVAGQILCISQFTLAANVRKGNRPSYIGAARPEKAEPMYQEFCRRLEAATGISVRQGVFGADMQVELVNDGPVTIPIDTAVLAR